MPARKRSAIRRISAAMPVALLLVVTLAPAVSAATVKELTDRATTNWKMTCSAKADQVTCNRDALPLWSLRILPATGPVDTVITDVSGMRTFPLNTDDPNSVDWMADMHQFACGDPKGIQAFATNVGSLQKPATLGPVVRGTCTLNGGLFQDATGAPFYRIISRQNPPTPPTPTPTVGPTSTPAPTKAPTPTHTPQPSPTPMASLLATTSAAPSATASAAPGETPAATPSTAPSPVVGGAETGPPAPGPSTPIAGPGQASAAPGPVLTQPTFDQSVLAITDVNIETGAIGGSLLLALLMLLIIGFAGELFNNTVENNYSVIAGWLRKGQLGWIRNLGGSFLGEARIGLVAFLLLTALVSCFVDPNFGLDLRSLGEFLGFLVGLVIVLATFKLPPMLAHKRETGDLGRLRPLPWALVIAAVFVLISRIGNLQPGYLYGIVLGAIFVKEVSPREEGRETFYGSLWTLGAALLGWLGLTWLHGLGVDPSSFAFTLLATACAAVTVAGLEATAFGLMPLRFMPGYAVYRWNRLAWALLWGLSLFGFLHILIAPTSGYVSQLSPSAFAAALAVFAAFGALSILTWGYFRFRRSASPMPSLEARFD